MTAAPREPGTPPAAPQPSSSCATMLLLLASAMLITVSSPGDVQVLAISVWPGHRLTGTLTGDAKLNTREYACTGGPGGGGTGGGGRGGFGGRGGGGLGGGGGLMVREVMSSVCLMRGAPALCVTHFGGGGLGGGDGGGGLGGGGLGGGGLGNTQTSQMHIQGTPGKYSGIAPRRRRRRWRAGRWR